VADILFGQVMQMINSQTTSLFVIPQTFLPEIKLVLMSSLKPGR
jgi:hypothetical protein